MVTRIWPMAVAGKPDNVSSVSASACHIGGPNSVSLQYYLQLQWMMFFSKLTLIKWPNNEISALRLSWSSIGIKVHIATWPPYSQSKSWQGTGICVNHIHVTCIRRVQSDGWGHVLKKRSCRVEATYLVKFCTGAGACICGFLDGLKCKVHPSISSCVSSKAEPDDMRPAPNGSVVENKFHLLDHSCNL